MITTRGILTPAEEAKSKQDLAKLVDTNGNHFCSYPVAKGCKTIEVCHKTADGMKVVAYERTGKRDGDYTIFKEKA